jgi:GT2 family glycosyltransferase
MPKRSSIEKDKSTSGLVSVIFPNYNGKDLTIDYLKSLKKTTYPKIEIIIVDNASTDGSVKAIKEKFPHVKIIRNKKNLGPARAFNQGIKQSKGEYVIITDNDMFVHDPEWVTELVKTAESDEKIGCVIPKRVFYDDPDDIQTEWGKSLAIRQTAKNYRKYKVSKFVYKLLGTPAFVTGLALMKRKVLDELGPEPYDVGDSEDERIFDEFCDIDLHYRVTKAGYKVVYEPKSKISHKGLQLIRKYNEQNLNESLMESLNDKRKLRYSRYYQQKLRFILKNYEFPLMPFTLVINLAYFMFLIPYFTIQNKFDRSRGARDGVVWTVKNWRNYI